MKIISTAAKWLFILGMPILLLSGSIAAAINSAWWYEYEFEKNGISQVTGLSPTELDKAATGLISYFNSGEEYISLTVTKDGQPFQLFNEREIVHLKDVKALFWLDYRLLAGTLAYALIYAGFALWRRTKPQLASGLAWGSGLTLALMLALGVGALFDFDQLFIQFHLLSFSNDFWQLDPARDYLIMLVPQGFWYDTFFFIAVGTAAMAVALGGVGWYLRQRIAPDATASPD